MDICYITHYYYYGYVLYNSEVSRKNYISKYLFFTKVISSSKRFPLKKCTVKNTIFLAEIQKDSNTNPLHEELTMKVPSTAQSLQNDKRNSA